MSVHESSKSTVCSFPNVSESGVYPVIDVSESDHANTSSISGNKEPSNTRPSNDTRCLVQRTTTIETSENMISGGAVESLITTTVVILGRWFSDIISSSAFILFSCILSLVGGCCFMVLLSLSSQD